MIGNGDMDIRKELELLDLKLNEGLTEENIATIERINSLATEEANRETLEVFVERKLMEVEADIDELECAVKTSLKIWKQFTNL